jgi:hypothetical protein
MTTTHSTTPTTTDAKAWPLLAAAGVGLAIVLVAISTFWDLTGNDDSGKDLGMPEFLAMVGVTLVGAAIVFGLVARTASASNGGQRGLVLAVLGFLSLVVFWTGLPCVFAAGAAACALVAAPRGATAKVALGIAGVTTVLAVVAAIIG